MRRAAVLALVAASLAACGGPTGHPPVTPAPTPEAPGAATTPEAPAAPPADDRLAFWQAVHADQDRPPAGTTAAALVPELVALLGSPDPARRDGIAYEVLAAWILEDRQLGPDDLRALIASLTANLRGPLPAGGGPDDTVFRRSFSALILSVVAARDAAEPFLRHDEVTALIAAAAAYAGAEPDLRGHTGAAGWAHAAAHTADWLKFLARAKVADAADLAAILDAVAALITRGHGHIFHHGEDGRLARPVIEVLRRGLADAVVDAWVARVVAPAMVDADPGTDPAAYAAQRNARNLAFTLFVQLSTEPTPTPAMTHALASLRRQLGG